MSKLRGLLCALILTFLSQGNTQDINPLLAESYQHVLDSILSANNLTGGAAAILMPGDDLWMGASGNSHESVPITGDMLFRFASNTKLFVATIILQLVDDGILTLDDPISKWLKPYTNVDSTITIRQLLQHTSGIDDYLENYDIVANPSVYMSPESLLIFIGEPYFAAGTNWRYSNSNYILAGLVINAATQNDTIAHTFRERIFDPLGLHNTFFEGEETVIGTMAHGWDGWDVGVFDVSNTEPLEDIFDYPQQSLISGAWTAGAMVSNVEDMAYWIRAVFTGQLFSADRLDDVTNFVIETNPSIEYSLGAGILHYGNEIMWGHGGAHWGYSSQAAYNPKYQVSISVVINSSASNGTVDIIMKELHERTIYYIDFPFDKAYPLSIQLNRAFTPVAQNLRIKSKINNPQNNDVNVFAHYFNADSSILDSVQLFDDGQHSDSIASDGLFGADLTVPDIEDNFYLKISSHDLQTNYRHVAVETKQFTTKGPISVDRIEITSADTVANPGDIISFDLFLKNNGTTAPVSEISSELVPLDSCLSSINLGNRTIESLAAGQVSEHNRTFRLQIDDECAPATMAVQVNMYANENLFWIDTLFIDIVSSLADPEPVAATRFHLQPNYPNPFNPETVIEYTVRAYRNTPVRVELSIYNVLGEKIATLVDQQQVPGEYSVKWDATNFPSGVYFYKLKAASFEQSRKMILMK